MDRSEYKDRVLAAVPIEHYIGRYVALKKEGPRYKGLCPFHTEKTPSFFVTPEKGRYHCFGCGRGGNVFSFVMEMEGVSFPQALDILADYAGIEKPSGKYRSQDRKVSALVAVNEKAAVSYYEYLQGERGRGAREYLRERGVNGQSLEKFRVGLAPDSGSWLSEHLTEPPELLLEAGLQKKNERGGSYDFFRQRVIFPIRDENGRTVAFGGRVLPGNESPAKYLNSPETLVFKKNRILYGLHEGLKEIRHHKECIITEGYLDVIGLHQAGFPNTVAPLGTALSEMHLRLLHRYTGHVVFLPDGDEAGLKAALRSSRLVVDHGGITAEVCLLPPGTDPFDAAISQQGRMIAELLKNRFAIERFLIMECMFPEGFQKSGLAGEGFAEDPVGYSRMAREYYLENESVRGASLQEKRTALNRLYDFMKGMENAPLRDLFLREGALILEIPEEDLKSEWNRTSPPAIRKKSEIGRENVPRSESIERSGRRNVQQERDSSRFSPMMIQCERKLLVNLIRHPSLFGEYLEKLQNLGFREPLLEVVYRNLESRYLTGQYWTEESLMKSELPEDALSLVDRELEEQAQLPVGDAAGILEESRAIIRDLLLKHRLQEVEEQLVDIREEIRMTDILERDRLLNKWENLNRELKEIEESLSRSR